MRGTKYGVITRRISRGKLVRLRLERRLYLEWVRGALTDTEYGAEIEALDDYEPDCGREGAGDA